MTQLATLADAIDWARDRWDQQRAVPTRLHTREEEGTGLTRDRKGCKCLGCTNGPGEDGLGSHAFSPAFRAALDGKPDTVVTQSRTVSCYHPLLAAGLSPRDCPECIGSGVKEARSDLYAYPMTLALHKLRRGLASRRHPHPYGLVIVLAAHGWRAPEAARALAMPWDRAEALFLMALRRLHNYYSEGPVDTRSYASRTVGWLEMSDSQRAAIEAGETAA